MAVPTTNISFHLITDIQAIDHSSFGKPMILRLESRYGGTELAFFFEDETLTKRLVEAINGVIKTVKSLDACPEEIAAYNAAHLSYDDEGPFASWENPHA
jgi:hypothetical protein